MIRGLLTVLASALLAQAATAEPVLVRTAEHGGFTRVVVDFTDRPTWALGRVGQAYELRTDREDIDFDLSDVYRRIYAGRLVSLDQAGPGDLRLTTGCACTLTTTLRPNGGLIIDISDGPPPADSPFEQSLSGPDADPPPQPAPRPSTRLAELPMSAGLTAPNVLPIVSDKIVREMATGLGTSLAEEIGRAAEMDLVELAPGVTADSLTGRNAPASGDADRDMGSSATIPEEADRIVPEGPNLRIVTEAERALTERGSLTSVDPSLCARLEKVLNPNQWVDEGPGPAGVEIDRKDLIDIRGEADPRGFRNLIRSYLYLTFGREALAALQAAPDDLVYKELYSAIARIVEDRPPGNNALAGMTSCPGHTGLWARLADLGAVAYKNDTTRPAAFAEWPEHLRRTLGPRLVEAYLDAGDEETARSLFHAIARISAPDDPDVLLLAAQLADPVDGGAAEYDAMAEIAQTRRPESAGALIGVIQARIAEDVPVGADLAMQAGALAFELAETEGAADLRAAEIRALVHDGFWKAGVTRLEAHDPLPDRHALVSALVSAAAEQASDTDLLWLAARMEGEHDVARPARAEMAARIAGLGVAEMARAALDLGAAIPNADERRILAEIALLEDHPSIAEAYLTGLDTAADAVLMARAQTMRERQTAAAAAGYMPQPETEMAETPAPEEPVEVARNAPPLPVLPEGGLQASRTLLGDSADLRNELEALLGANNSR